MTQNSLDGYLGKVNMHLLGIPSDARAGILAELRDHMEVQASEVGTTPDSYIMDRTIKPESPKKVAKRYKGVYGYSNLFKVLFAIVGIILGIATIPVWELVSPGFSSSFWLLVLIVYLYWVGTRAGKRVGFAVGLAVALSRLVLLSIIATALTPQGAILDSGLAFAFGLTSLILVFIGFIPGEARKKWKERAEIEFR